MNENIETIPWRIIALFFVMGVFGSIGSVILFLYFIR
jgi:hypothetical protein